MRLKAQKTTTDMAKIAGIKTRKTYENWEKNKAQPNMNQFIKMVEACGFDCTNIVYQCLQRRKLDNELVYREKLS